MPLISKFYGIKIFIHWDDHYPMHFHAHYAEFSIVVSIEDTSVIEGYFPSKQLKLVLAWATIHKKELLQCWKLSKQNQPLEKIDPLR